MLEVVLAMARMGRHQEIYRYSGCALRGSIDDCHFRHGSSCGELVVVLLGVRGFDDQAGWLRLL